MNRPGVAACAFAAVVMAAPLTAAEGTAAAGYDVDDVSISASRADLSARVSWSQSSNRPGTGGRLSGELSADRGCARVRVEWLNAGTAELASASRSVCGGAESVTVRFRHEALECARVELFHNGDQVGPTRLVCAGGS